MIQNKTKYSLSLIILLLLSSFLMPTYAAEKEKEVEIKISKENYRYEYVRAQEAFDRLEYSRAIKLYNKLIRKGYSDDIVKQNLAISYYKSGDMKQAGKHILKRIKKGKASIEEVGYYVQILKYKEDYAEASKYEVIYLSMLQNRDTDLSENLIEYLDSLKKEEKYMVKAMPFNAEGASDFGAVPFNKEKELVFVSSRKSMKGKLTRSENALFKIYVTSPDGSKKPKLLSPKLSSSFHDGPICFNKLGNEAFFATNAKGKKGNKNQVIKWSKMSRDGSWSRPITLSFIEDGYSYTHPYYDSKKRTLYFASNMPGGVGGYDIWYVKSAGKNKWKEPVNVGNSVNTAMNESFPFMRNKKLFFSSNGHVGFGGLDIYQAIKTTATKDTTIYDVTNMGYPINSSSDDFSFYIGKKEKKGYLASNRTASDKKKKKPGLQPGAVDNIYGVSLIERDYYLYCNATDSVSGERLDSVTIVLKDVTKKPRNVQHAGSESQFIVDLQKKYAVTISRNGYYPKTAGFISQKANFNDYIASVNLPLAKIPFYGIHGVVSDMDDKTPLEGVEFILRLDSVTEIPLNTDIEGQYKSLLEKGNEYAVIVRKKGYIPQILKYSTVGIKDGWIEFPVELEKVQLGKSMVVYFELNVAEINEKAVPELEDMVKFMVDNPKQTFEVGAHTDARGSDKYNQRLSDKRANAIVKYMIGKGIDSKRISAQGYGESQLVNDCGDGVECSEEEHQANRRCEIKVTGM